MLNGVRYRQFSTIDVVYNIAYVILSIMFLLMNDNVLTNYVSNNVNKLINLTTIIIGCNFNTFN